jgi:uncharacterized phage infection (PIP) family protein YhgE
MNAIRTLLSRTEARAALAVWTLVPAVFLFFGVTLAVNPAEGVDQLELGVAVADEGVTTPQGQVAIGPRIAEGLEAQLGLEITTYGDEAALEDAVLAREVAAGIAVPAGTTERLMSGEPIHLTVVRSDANDPFTNQFTANLATQLQTNLNAALPSMLPGAEQPAPPPVAVDADVVAASADFRFSTVIGAVLLPLWIATLAFAALTARAGNAIRGTIGAARTAAAELTVLIGGAGLVAAVIAFGLPAFAWTWEVDLLALFAIAWLALAAMGLVLLGTVRAVGLELGAALGVLALFVQQPVSGAAYPAAMAPDVVRWAEPFAPLGYLVEGVRNALIGGSTMPDAALALAIIGVVGVGLTLVGFGRLALMPARGRRASVQAA